MKVFSIADVHLSLSVENKAMDVFGRRWEHHMEKLAAAWRETVGENDLVLINGDISWAMQFQDARSDLFYLHCLPGRKVLSRGNHDYWWTGYHRLLAELPPSMTAVQNNTVAVNGVYIAGTRLWNMPGSSVFKEEEDRKIYEREKLRLSMSLQGLREGETNVVMLHYPPFFENGETSSEITALIEAAPVSFVVYGHLHGPAGAGAYEGTQNGVTYCFTAADRLNFRPKLLFEV